MDQDLLCSICDKILYDNIENVVSMKEKGLKTLIMKSMENNDNKCESWYGKSVVYLHEKCRKRYPLSSATKRARLAAPLSQSNPSASAIAEAASLATFSPSSSTRQANMNFDFSNLCFICEKPLDLKHKRERVHTVINKCTQEQMIDLARRKNNQFGHSLIIRIQNVNLVDYNAAYHWHCYHNLKSIQKESSLNEQSANIFSNVCRYIENSGQYQFSLQELKNSMGKDTLSNYVLFRMLEEKYKEDIFISHNRGKQPTIHYKMLDISRPFAQFVFDNTDHNVKTLDGKETFHCLGGVVIYTPDGAISFENRTVKRKKMPKASDLVSRHVIPQVPYGTFNGKALERIKFIATKDLRLESPAPLSPSYSAYVWAKSLDIEKIPSWKGYMEVLSTAVPYSKSQVVCLPFINGPPSNLTTLNSSLHYAASETRKLNRKTCFVTYDQPLYAKALSILQDTQGEELKNVVVRLGGFHLLMSYLGAIGYIMAESGIEDLWMTVYAGDSVKKMLTGHAYARALRAHIMSFTALGIMICNSLNPSDEFTDFVHQFFNRWDSEPPLLQDCDQEAIADMCGKFVHKLELLENNGPTSKLWVQYFKSIVIALQFLEAERLGNWQLHLQSVEQMLPYFHAAGHYQYAKYGQIYLQQMASLELFMDPMEFDEFTKEGYFTICRSDKAWPGVWSDMIIEQTLNRFFGTDLKQGRGVASSVVTRYSTAMPSAFKIMEYLESYCNIVSRNSEQHVYISRSRMKKDDDGNKRFLFWLNQRKPF